jgi:hypothetical protein
MMWRILSLLVILIAPVHSFAQADSNKLAIVKDTLSVINYPGVASVVFDDNKPDGSNMDDQHFSEMFFSSRDLYLSTTTLNLTTLGFSPRGYDRKEMETYMGGIFMNNIKTGTSVINSALNDVLKDRSIIFGLQNGDETYGGLAGSANIEIAAADKKEQTLISYANANRTYRNRLMVAYNTGLLDNGWAISLALSRRRAKEEYIEVTSYNSYAYYLGISKKLTKSSFIHFATFGNPEQNGGTISATQEPMDLVDNNFYNPAWGNQGGVKRNSKINKSFQPVYLLQYEYNPNNLTHFSLSFSYQHGYNGTSGLDWYSAADPRPDYYKKLPGFYLNDPANRNTDLAALIKEKWINDPGTGQINWNELYEANRLNIDKVNGVEGRRSAYVLGEDRDVNRVYSLAATYQKVLHERFSLYSGLSFTAQQTESYRKMLDLLGGDFYVNLNQFAERTYAGNNSMKQIDLNHPDQIIRVGDKYGYDYVSRFIKSSLWAQVRASYTKFDLFVAGRMVYDAFGRDGLYKNGLFPDSSFGKSVTQQFFTYQVKGGFTYKVNNYQRLFINVATLTRAPAFDNTFISPKTRNNVISHPVTEQVHTMEAGYVLHASKVSGKLTAFATDINDATRIKRFYYEEDNTFVNYVMQHIDIRHVGIEMALQAKIIPSLTATATATWMQVFYNSRPQGSLYRDNDTTTFVAQHTSYLQDYYVATGPQSVYTLGFRYKSSILPECGINFNLTDRNYVDINPLRHTEDAVTLLPQGSTEQEIVLRQEKLPSAFTVDIFAGKTFSLSGIIKWLPRKIFLNINAGVSNLLNRKDIRIHGNDQLRFDNDTKNPGLFPTKYTYGYGANYFVSCSLKF